MYDMTRAWYDNQISGGQKCGQSNFWPPEIPLTKFLATRNSSTYVHITQNMYFLEGRGNYPAAAPVAHVYVKISGDQNFVELNFWGPEIHLTPFLATRNSPWPPTGPLQQRYDMIYIGTRFLVTRNLHIHVRHLRCCWIVPPPCQRVHVFGHLHNVVCGGISGGQKFGQWDFWWPEVRSNTFLTVAARGLV